MMFKRYRKFRLRFVDNLPRYREIARMTPVGSVLDFGCGEGFLGRILQDRGCSVTGCDISDELLDKCPFPARKLNLNEPTDFEDDQFETVVSSDVLEHLEDPVSALREMQRIASRNVIVSVPNSKGYFLFRLMPSLENPHEKYSPHLHHWNLKTFPMPPGMPLVEKTFCTDFFEFRFTNPLHTSFFSQTIVMKFDAAAGKAGEDVV